MHRMNKKEGRRPDDRSYPMVEHACECVALCNKLCLVFQTMIFHNTDGHACVLFIQKILGFGKEGSYEQICTSFVRLLLCKRRIWNGNVTHSANDVMVYDLDAISENVRQERRGCL